MNHALVRQALMVAAHRRIPAGDSDPYWSSVVSLLHFDGDLTDQKGITWTAVGSAQTDGTPKFGSGAFNGDNASRIHTPSTAAFDISVGDFTIEAFIQPVVSTADYECLCHVCPNTSTSVGSVLIGVRPDRKLGVWLGDTSSTWGYANGAASDCSTNPLSTSGYSHVALTRYGDVFDLWVDGDSVWTKTIVGATLYKGTDPTAVAFFNYSGGTHHFNGLIDEFRLTAVARYTAPFTPPNAAFPSQ